MEELETLQEDTLVKCSKCGKSMGYKNDGKLLFCEECKLEISKSIIPKKIKIFLAIICLCIIYSIVQLPNSIMAVLAYEKGLGYKEENKQVSAIEEFNKVLEIYPNAETVLDEIFESYYHDLRIGAAIEIFNKMVELEKYPGMRYWGKRLASNEDTERRNNQIIKSNEIMEKISKFYYYGESYPDLIKNTGNKSFEEKIMLYEKYIEANPNDFIARYELADVYFNMGKYDKSEATIKELVEKNKEWKYGVQFLAAIKREKRQYEEAVKYSNLLFENNSESIFGYIMLSKIELKRGNDVQGLEYALKAKEIARNEEETYGILSLAYHFNGEIENRNKYLEKFNEIDGLDDYSKNFINSIISGERKWR